MPADNHQLTCKLEELLQSDPLVNGALDSKAPAAEGFAFIFAKAREHWAFALCSGAGEVALRRYFTYYAQTIFELVSDAPNPENDRVFKQEARLLATHLFDRFGRYVDRSLILPVWITRQQLERCGPAFGVFKNRITLIGEPLRDILSGYVNHISRLNEPICSAGQILYLEMLVSRVNAFIAGSIPWCLDTGLTDLLISTNFNDLSFLAYVQDRFSGEIAGLPPAEQLPGWRRLAGIYSAHAGDDDIAFDTGWPPARQMLHSWIGEEIAALNQAARVAPVLNMAESNHKLPVNISVAQLACLTKLFFEEGLSRDTSLTDIFRFISANFKTRRQPLISARSASKEFYGVSQVTAAAVLDLLQKMIARIKRVYFPAMVAISVMLLC